MIKNVIFDFGKVMVHFEPKYMVEQYVQNPDDSALLQEVIFDRRLWDRLDEGSITDSEVLSACRERLPSRLHADAERIYFNWIYHIPEIEGMRDLVREIKEKFGVRVFLLSNISTYFAAHKDEIPCLAEFEGCVFSAVCGKIKPHADIFAHLCDTYGIAKGEALFIDDNENNVRGAEAFGIWSYLFDGDVGRLRAHLLSVLR